MHRTGRSIGAFVTGLFLQLSSLSIGLFAAPLLLNWLGDERYGTFRVANDWIGYVGLLELGVSGSLMSLLAQSIGRGNQKQVYLTLVTGIRAYIKVAAVMAIAALGLGYFITHLIQVKGSLIHELQTGYWLGCLSILLIPLVPFRRLADASQRSYWVNMLMLFQSLFITGIALLLAWIGFGIPGQFVALFFGNVFFSFLMSWDGLRRYPKAFAALVTEAAQVDIERRLWQLNLPTFILFLSSQISFLTDNIIVSYYLGPALVVPFFVTQRLAVLTQTQLQAIGNATWAALADLYTRGERQIFNARLIELTQLVTIVGFAMMVAIFAYNPYFVEQWVGQARFSGDTVTFLAASNGILLGLFTLWTWCFMGTGHIAAIMPPIICSTIMNLSISLISTQIVGIIGPLLGTFLASVSINLWWLPLLLKQVFDTPIQKLFLAITKPLVLGLPYAFIIYWLARSHTPHGWLGLAIEMGLSVLLYLMIAWSLVFDSSTRLQWRDRLHVLLPGSVR